MRHHRILALPPGVKIQDVEWEDSPEVIAAQKAIEQQVAGFHAKLKELDRQQDRFNKRKAKWIAKDIARDERRAKEQAAADASWKETAFYLERLAEAIARRKAEAAAWRLAQVKRLHAIARTMHGPERKAALRRVREFKASLSRN